MTDSEKKRRVQAALDARNNRAASAAPVASRPSTGNSKVQRALEAREQRIRESMPELLTDIGTRYKSAADAYNSTQAKYNAYDEVYKGQQERRKELAELRAKVGAYSRYMDQKTAQELLAGLDQMGQGYDTYLTMSRYATENAWNKALEEAQAKAKRKEEILSAPDFEELSQYVSTVGDRKFVGYFTNNHMDKTYEYINDRDGARKSMNRVTVGGNSMGALNNKEFYDRQNLSEMTQEEVSIYNYLYAKEGKESAEEYLNSIREELNMRRGGEIAREVRALPGIVRVPAMAAVGLGAGGDQFFTGAQQFFTGEKLPTTAVAKANSDIYNSLDGFGQQLYSATNVIGNMAPSILVSSAATALGLPGKAAEGLGAAAMGVSAAGNAYADALEKGYDKGVARLYSTLVGASEAGLQFLLGGIGKLGGVTTQKIMSKVAMIDNSLLRIAAKLGVDFLGEVTEEEIQNFLEPALRSLILGEDYDLPTMEEILETAVVTAITTPLLGGVDTVWKDIANTRYYRDTYGDVQQDLVGKALELTPDSKYAQKLQERLKGGNNLNGNQLGRLLQQNESALVNRDREAIQKATEARLTELGETGDVTAVAAALTKKAAGETLTRAERKLVDGSKYGTRVEAEMDPNNAGTHAGGWTRNIGTERIRADAYNSPQEATAQEVDTEGVRAGNEAEKATAAAAEASAQESAGEAAETAEAPKEEAKEPEIAEDGVTRQISTGKAVTPKKIVSIENGKAVVETDGGKISSDDIAYGDGNTAILWNSPMKLQGIDVMSANGIIKAYDGSIPVAQYMRGAAQEFRNGYNNLPSGGEMAAELDQKTREIIYEIGQKAAGRAVAKAQAKATEAKRAGKQSKKEGKVVFDRKGRSFSDVQETALKTMEQLSRVLGVEFHVFESYEKDGRRVFVNDNGQEVDAPNGFYEDGKIYIDLNAGNDGNGTMLFTVAHELTHFIKEWSPAKFKILANLLVKDYTAKGQSVQELIDAQIAKAERSGRTIDEDEAFEEVVADSMEAILTDGNVVEFMAAVKQQDQKLWEKIRQWFKDLAEDLRKLVEAYKGVKPDSKEGRMVSQMQDLIRELEAAYGIGLLEASENLRAAEENTAGEGGVKYSFAGTNAETANRSLLEKAQQMEEQGSDNEQIRKETGWFRGMDGKWRFEIDDSQMEIAKEISNYMRLGELMQHPSLYVAYPDLADIPVVFHSLGKGVNGAYNPQFDSIDFSYSLKNDPVGLKDALAHELQHAIQHREGFTTGATAEGWERKIKAGFDARRAEDIRVARETEQELRRIQEEEPEFYRDMLELDAMTPDMPRGEVDWDTLEKIEDDPVEWQRYDAQREALEEKYGDTKVWDMNDLLYKRQKAAQNTGRSSVELYFDTAGEIEARNVAGRRNLTSEQRKNTPPSLGNDDTVFADGTGASADYVGKTADGVEAYETSEKTKNLTWAERKKAFLNLMRQQYRGRTAKFIRNGHAYYARFEYRDVSKNIYGDDKSDPKGRDAKINVGADGDIFELVENSKYSRSETERGKQQRMHRGVKHWDYFVKTVQIDGTVFDLTANVRKKADGEFVYIIEMVENNEIEPSSPQDSQNSGRNRVPNSSTVSINRKTPDVKEESVKKKFSLRDSQGKGLSEGQQEYFKDSQARDASGHLLVLYHQTSGEFTIFDTRHPGAGSRDSGTPFGVFLKQSAGDIGLSGKKQMALYANIKNPLWAVNREDLATKLSEISPRYADIESRHKKLDAEYHEKFEQAKKAWRDYLTAWREANPNASRRAAYDDPKFTELFDAEDKIIEEWTEKADLLSIQAKEAITEDLRKAGYDGVFLENDVGSWGRRTDAIIALDSNQVKNVDNRNPTENPDIRYSARDPEAQEVNRALEKENAKLKEDVERLKELVQLQKQVTGGTKFTKTSLEAAARQMKKDTNAKGDTKELQKLLEEVYGHIAGEKELTWEGVKEAAAPAVEWLKKHVQRDSETSGYAKDVLKDIRNIRIVLDDSQRREVASTFGSYNDYRKRLMGSVTLANEGISLDSQWHEWAQEYLNIFDPNLSASDMPNALAEAIDRLRGMTEDGGYLYDEEFLEQELLRSVYDSYWKVSTLYTVADRYQKKINKLKFEHSGKMTELRQEARDKLENLQQAHRAEVDRIRKAARANQEEQIRQIREQNQASRKKAVDSRRRTEARRKIRKTIMELKKILNHGNKKRNVKEGMRDFVETAIASAEVMFLDDYSEEAMIRNGVEVEVTAEENRLIDETQSLMLQRDYLFNTDRMAAEGVADVSTGDVSDVEARTEASAKLDRQITKNMRQLKGVFERERNRIHKATVTGMLDNLAEAYRELGKSDDLYIRGAVDENVYQKLKSLGEDMKGDLLRDLDLEQLDKLHDAYKMVLHSVREANKLFAEGKAKSLQQLADDIALELGSRNIPTGNAALIAQKAANKLGWNYEKLYYALDRIGSKSFAELINRVADSEDTVMRDAKEAHDFLLETVKKHGYNDWNVNREIDRVFKDSTGREFQLTLGQMMSLYAYSRRKGAWDHIQYGGFVFGKAALTNPRPADSYKLTREQCEAITNLLTPEQKAYAEEMQKYLSEVMGAKGNEVSMKLYGIEMFKEKNYFPIHVAGQFQAKAQESQAKQAAGFGSMSNAGFTQTQNPNAKAPFVLEAFNEVWADHVNEMARYHGAVPALEDLRRVMNRSAYLSDTESSTSIKQIMENHYGKEAVEYFDNLYREANSGAVYEKLQKLSKKLLGLFRKNSVAYSLSVLVQQPASIVRAYAMVDRKYFGIKGVGAISSGAAKAIFRKEVWEKTYAEMLKYAPGVTLAKEIGGFDTASGGSIRQYLLDTGKSFRQQMNTGTGKEKAGAVMNLVDDNKVANLPNVADKIAWVEIWNACKRETVYNNPSLSTGSEEFMEKVGQRFTEVIRATQVYDSIFAKSPMLKSKNLAVQMLVSFMNEPNTTANMVESALRDFGRKQKKLGLRKLQVVLHSILFTGVMKSIIYAMRDDDEDETFVEKYMESLTGSILDDVNPANYIPIARDIWSLAQGYDVERADMSIVSDAVDALNSVVNNAQTDTENMTEAQLVAFDQKCTKANWRLAESIAAFLGIPMKNVRREINAVLNTAKNAYAKSGKATWKSVWYKIQDAALDSIPFADTPDKTEKLYRAVTSGDKQYRKRFEDAYESESELNSALRKALRAHDPRVREAAKAMNSGDNAKYRKLLKEITGEGHFSGENIEAAIQAEAEKLAVADFVREYPEADGITYAAVIAYKEASNVPAEVFYEAWQYKSGRKKEEVLGYINGLELTRKQKDALYLAFGWAESKLDEAPWN